MMDDAGLFWDGLGSWVKNLPQLTLRIPVQPRAPVPVDPPGGMTETG